MAKIVYNCFVSLDGFIEGPNGEIDWHDADADFLEFGVEQLNSAAGLIFGRVTYQGMSSYWPTSFAIEGNPEVANLMNSVPKYVFSRSLETVPWGDFNNAYVISGDLAEEITKLKQQHDKDLLIYGSADLASDLIVAGLVDEICLIVDPVLIGNGKRVFKEMDQRVKLRLVKSTTFRSGKLVLYYRPEAV